MAKLKIYLLGRVDILLNDESILHKLSHKSIGILSYMAEQRHKKFNRNKIADIFWDSNDFDTSRYNLRYNIWQLRKLFKQKNEKIDPFISDKETISLNDNIDIYVDVEEFQKGVENQDINSLEKIKKLYKGEFLEGFYIKDSPEFNDWVFYEREKLQRNYIKILTKLKDSYKDRREYQKAIKILEDKLSINPLKESLYLELINIYIQIGDRNKALHHYNRCVKRLREELNISPAIEIKNAYKNIMNRNNKTDIKEIPKPNLINTKNKYSNLYIIKEHDKEKFIENSIFLKSYPLGDIEYYVLSELIDKIIKKYDEILLKVDDSYLYNVCFVNSKVQRYIRDKNVLLNMATKINIFKSLEKIIEQVSLEEDVTIVVDKFKFIDDISLEFIEFILYRENIKNIKIIIISEEYNEKVEKLKNIKGGKK
ncbi:AfsR/SARP family transcriptional regulator [Senegalia massiliensis]|uniref:AfsR/SARP family transcriptional regulator n=1 Tax=Senegalia massiliensis TaxID=1720316 RepID=UPI001031DE56|nr:BTAD domain-containing putative transcriptional regulator [Senegalia massiliensis]